MTSLDTITKAAAEKHLPFLLAGGHAVIAHGHQRGTFDLDLVIRRNDRDHWIKLAQGLGYSVLQEGPTFIQFTPPKPQVLPLDMITVNDQTYAKLAAEAVPVPETEAARMVSLQHLLA